MKPTKLKPVTEIENFAVIIRCIHERGETQEAAFRELNRRGLWLTEEQRRQSQGIYA